MDTALPTTLAEDWRSWFTTEATRPRGLDIYPELFMHPVLFPLQRQREMAAMMRTASDINPTIVMEIGADKGGGFYHWIKCHPGVRRAIACEIRGTPYAEAFRQAFPEIDFLFLPESSRTRFSLESVRKFLGRDLLSCLFIDGDKEHCEDDFYLYLPFMRYEGLICLHDIHGEAKPVQVFNKLCQAFLKNSTLIDFSEGEEAMARGERGEPILSCYEGWLRVWKTTSCGVGCIWV